MKMYTGVTFYQTHCRPSSKTSENWSEIIDPLSHQCRGMDPISVGVTNTQTYRNNTEGMLPQENFSLKWIKTETWSDIQVKGGLVDMHTISPGSFVEDVKPQAWHKHSRYHWPRGSVKETEAPTQRSTSDKSTPSPASSSSLRCNRTPYDRWLTSSRISSIDTSDRVSVIFLFPVYILYC